MTGISHSFADLNLKEFTEKLASNDAVPGGGGASALVGSLGICLGSMVASLTVGRKKYADVWDEMEEVIQKADALRRRLLELIDLDAKMFEPLSRAYSLPHSTPEEIKERELVMKSALRDACTVPLEIMETMCRCIEIVDLVSKKGTVMAVSDAGDAASFCRASLQGAALNVYINTKLMKDRELAHTYNRRVDEMLQVYVPMADEIYIRVLEQLRKC